jgi:two-component system LytT family response regulator
LKLGFLERLPVRSGDDIVLVPVDEVASIVADHELLHLTTARGARHVLSFRLKDVEARLDPADFVRVSRSALVNFRHLERISPLPGGMFLAVLSNRQEIPVSRSQSRVLRERFLRI